MRIALACPSFPPDVGGVAQVALRQAIYLIERGHEVRVFSGGSQHGGTSSTNGVQEMRFPIAVKGFPSYAAGDILGVSTQLRERYLVSLDKYEPDVILSHCWQAWNTDWLITRGQIFHDRLVIFSHGTSIHSGHGRAGYVRRLRWSQYTRTHLIPGLKRARRLIVLEDYQDDDRFFDVKLARTLGAPYTVVPNGFNPNIDVRGCIQSLRDGNTAIFVGQFTRDKGADTVFEKFDKFAPQGWRLRMYGSKRTPLLRELEQRQNPRVSFHVGLGPADIAGAYNDADLMLHASRSECQPLVLIDAMAAGVAFISTDVGSVSALNTGVIVRDEHAFGPALQALCTNRRLLNELAERGRHQALTKYNWERSLRTLDTALGETAERA